MSDGRLQRMERRGAAVFPFAALTLGSSSQPCEQMASDLILVLVLFQL
jgi:hypothetical protein